MHKIGVLISGGGTNLQAVIDACDSGEINGEVSLVISSSADAYGMQRAEKAGIKALHLEDQAEILSHLQEAEVDLLVLAGYLKQVSPAIIQAYPERIINIHPSLIPAFAGQGFYGMRVHEAALARGVKISGATTHLVNEDYDEGPIIGQKAVEVLEGDTAESLQERILQVEHPLLVWSINQLLKRINKGE